VKTLYRATEASASWGLVAEDGVVVVCAPYGRRRFLGRRLAELVARGIRLEALGPDPATEQLRARLAGENRDRNRGLQG